MPFSSTDTFETDLGNWANVGGDDFDWTRNSGGTPSAGTGPSGAHSGTWYVYTETSSPIANSNEALLLRTATLSGTVYAFTMNIQEHAAGAAMDNGGFLSVEAFKSATWTTIYTQSGQNGATGDGLNWQSKTVAFDSASGAPYDNSDLQVRIRVHVSDTGSAFQNDFAIDSIVITGTDRQTYKLEGITKDNSGSALGSCQTYLVLDNGDDTFGFIDFQTSNVASGAYSFTGLQASGPDYLVIAWKDDTPHVFDATDYVLTPVAE